MNEVLKLLPKVRGKYKANASLSSLTWFKVGGPADVLFIPEDTSDLASFLQNKPDALELNVLGLGSNLIIRDKGVSGCVIKLGQGFNSLAVDGCKVQAGCGLPNQHLVSKLAEHGLSGLEFLSAIPGSVGGAVAMNAGCYGHEIAEFLVSVEAVERKTGKVHQIPAKDLSLSYRRNVLADAFIFTNATFLLKFVGDRDKIRETINEISQMKVQSQPTREKTGGSTFKNPDPSMSKYKAWELIDQAGFRGYKFGGAQVSEKHTNFFINTGNATAEDLERLGEVVRAQVRNTFGVALEWEIKRMGRQ